MCNIVLTGMPGAGKSTLGVLLAKAMGLSFIDTDLVIQQKCGMLLNQIIEAKGQEGFLQIEEEVLTEAATLKHYVIATGGSAVLSARAMQALKQNGRVVYIHVSLPVLEKRLFNIKARGVVMGENESLSTLYEKRRPLYERYADLTFSAMENSVEESLALLVEMLG